MSNIVAGALVLKMQDSENATKEHGAIQIQHQIGYNTYKKALPPNRVKYLLLIAESIFSTVVIRMIFLKSTASRCLNYATLKGWHSKVSKLSNRFANQIVNP